MAEMTDDLLLLASELISRDPKRPKQASLRRSISNCYYAVFHRLVQDCCALLVPSTSEMRPIQAVLARSVDHGTIVEVCNEILNLLAQPKPKQSKSKVLLFGTAFQGAGQIHLEHFATHFVSLQKARHDADYDLAKRADKFEAQTVLTNARAAIADWKQLLTSDRPAAYAFAFLILHWKALKIR